MSNPNAHSASGALVPESMEHPGKFKHVFLSLQKLKALFETSLGKFKSVFLTVGHISTGLKVFQTVLTKTSVFEVLARTPKVYRFFVNVPGEV